MGAGCRHRLQSSPSPRLTPGSYFSSHAILTSTMIHDLITAFLASLGYGTYSEPIRQDAKR
jgi:hypothetical protein